VGSNFRPNSTLTQELRRYDLCSIFPRKSPFRPLFRAFYPHPARKSALRAEAATHRPAPGKPVWPPSSTWPLSSRATPHAPRPNSGVRSCADPPPLATACHRQPNWKRPSGARSQRAAPYASMSPNRAIVQEKSRLLAELHRDSLYPMIGNDTWVAGADRRGSPRAEACASGASPPAPPPATRIRAPLEWWSSARSLQKSNPLVLARRRPIVDRPLAAAGAQRQWLQACLPGGYKPPCLFSHCSPCLPEFAPAVRRGVHGTLYHLPGTV